MGVTDPDFGSLGQDQNSEIMNICMDMVKKGNRYVVNNTNYIPEKSVVFYNPNSQKIQTSYSSWFDDGNEILTGLVIFYDHRNNIGTVLHEYGHCIQNMVAPIPPYSENTGQHNIGVRYTTKLAFSEGWAQFFAAAVTNNSAIRGAFDLNANDPYNLTTYNFHRYTPATQFDGNFDEIMVAALLWEMHTTNNFGNILNSLTASAPNLFHTPYNIFEFIRNFKNFSNPANGTGYWQRAEELNIGSGIYYVDQDLFNNIPDIIQNVINAAPNNSIIYVRSGNYLENITINNNSDIALFGESTAYTKISANNSNENVITLNNSGTNYSLVNGFTIEDGEIGISINPDCKTYVSNNIIQYCQKGISTKSDIVVKNNVIRATMEGFVVPDLSTNPEIRIYNNNFDLNYTSSLNFADNANGFVRNNIITQSATGISASSSSFASSVTFEYNGYSNNTNNFNNISAGAGNITSDPNFGMFYILQNANYYDSGFNPASPLNANLEFIDRNIDDINASPNMLGIYGGPESFDQGSMNLPSNITGIEDGIYLSLPVTNEFNANQFYSSSYFNYLFQDVEPLGDQITSWGNTQIKASYGCGEITVMDSPGSSILISTLPNGYLWERNENGYVKAQIYKTGVDNDSVTHTASLPIFIKNVPLPITSGTLTSNTIWCEDFTLTDNITVPSGITLKINPGATIKFAANASLIVNGKLEVLGCTFISQSGTTANSWGSIELNGAGASGSIIDNCNILYGNGVRVINVPSFTISNNNLLDNYISLYIYGSTGGISGNTLSSNSIGHSIQLSYSNVDCNNNKITKTGLGVNRGHGIEHNQGSSGKVWRNDISYCDWGIAAIWGSSPTSRKPNTSILRNNRIRNCNSGLMVYRLSYPNFGIPSTPIYWGNSIYNNTNNAVVAFNYPTYASSLTASNCWWGAAQPNTAKFSVGSKGSFYYDFNLTSDPWAGFQKVSPENNIETETENLSVSNSVQSNANTDEDILYQCVELREQNKFTEAMNLCLSYLEKQPEDQAGYVELYNCYSEETAESIISYFSALPKEASSDLKLLLSYLYLKQGAAEKAKQVNEAIVATDENSDLSVKANLNNFYIALYTENDPDEAVDILLGMVDNTKLAKASESSVGEMSDAEYSLIQYSKIYDKQIPDLERLKQGIKTLAEGKPDKFELAQNFPNPFNPSTMISFQLPINGYVTLKIYDLLGQEIATLVNEQKSAGKYEVKFDASDLASGVYIYRIQAGEFNASKKLILLK